MIQLHPVWTLGPLLWFALLLSGCQQQETTPETPPQPAALMWPEYVEQVVGQRTTLHIADFPLKNGLPDMSLWRPEDFLTKEQLESPHVEFCDLPLEEKKRYYGLSRRVNTANPSELNALYHELLVYAREGLIQAQGDMVNLCLMGLRSEDYGVSEAELFDWLRKGAASGSAQGMSALGTCIAEKLQSRQIAANNMLVDEMLYWRWRATQSLDFMAVLSLNNLVGDLIYRNPTYSEDLAEQYKWSRLIKFLRIYRNTQMQTGPFDRDGFQTRYQLTDGQMAQGDLQLKDWLAANPNAFKNHRKQLGCPDMSWLKGGQAKFNPAALDAALKRFLQE